MGADTCHMACKLTGPCTCVFQIFQMFLTLPGLIANYINRKALGGDSLCFQVMNDWYKISVTISVNQFFVGNSDNFSKMMIKLKKKK